ncbi:MAG: hypothetical protein WC360_08930, partial [Opitutales bacterium]
FQEIIDEANRPDSTIRLEKLYLAPPDQQEKIVTVICQPKIVEMFGGKSVETTSVAITQSVAPSAAPIFKTEAEQKVAKAAYEIFSQYEHLANSGMLLGEQVQKEMAAKVAKITAPMQGELAGVVEAVNVAAVVKTMTTVFVQRDNIDIPRITVVPKGEVSSGFDSFTLDTRSIQQQPTERDILLRNLRTSEQETLAASADTQTELRPENYIVRILIDFDDISYDHHADLLYYLASQMVQHLRSYLKDEREVLMVLQNQAQARLLANFIHAQMQAHHWENAVGYEVVVSKGFTELKRPVSTSSDEPVHNFRLPVADKSKIAQMLFGGFSRCLFPVLKFQSDTERVLSIVVDRDADKWFRPARGQFQLYYKWGTDQREYQPDFVAETVDAIYMLEPKARNDMEDPEVQTKKNAAVIWCKHASDHNAKHGGKPWRYLLIPHDAIAENMTLKGLAAQYIIR